MNKDHVERALAKGQTRPVRVEWREREVDSSVAPAVVKWVTKTKSALFHGWFQYEGDNGPEHEAFPVGLVEFEDGTMDYYEASKLSFPKGTMK